MSILMVKTPDGNLRRVELSKNQPLTIGSHSISDIQINDPGIELMEARISWGKQQFEVTAANPKGVTHNGETVMAADLKAGDVLTLGATELIFTTAELLDQSLSGLTESEPSDPSAIERETDFGLAPISEEIPAWNQPGRTSSRSAPQPSAKATSSSETPSSPPRKTVEPPASSTSKSVATPEDDWETQDEELLEEMPLQRRGSQSSPSTPPESSPVEKLRESLHASRQRPGQKEIIRSPLVMGLSIGSFFLLVGAVILWSVIGREEADRYLQRAREQAEQRKYQQAIDDYQTYLLEFSGDADVETAFRELSITRVRSQIDIGVPDWKAGLKELNDLVDRHRDDPEFDRLHERISQFAEQIAKGVCEQAGREGDEELFDVSDSALKFIELYTTDEDRREKILSEVQKVRRVAESQISKEDDFTAAIAQMKSAIKQSKPFHVLDARRELIRIHRAAESDARVKKFLQQALDLEQSLVRQQREEKLAPKLPPIESTPVITLSATSRFSRDELPSGRPVYVHAADCLYGLDTATGEPIWRHVTGWDLPFFPLEVELGEPAILLYAERDGELQLLSRETGKLIWKQGLPVGVVGTPLVVGTQAFLSTKAGMLQQIDLSTGAMLATLSFSQPLATSPVLLPETQHGLLIGERELAYLIELNPPAIVDVLHFGHGPGSVATDPVRMGPLVLVAENDRSDSALLRVFDTRQQTPELVQTDEQRLSAENLSVQIMDAPVIRGKQLLIPSTPERVTAFTVSAEPDQPPLTEVSYFQVPNPRLTSTWLSAGPDGQIWMASSAVRRMHLTTESIEASSDVVAVGIATQPIQMLGDRMYVARRPDYGRVVRFSRLDRNDFTGAWRVALGDRVLQSSLNSSGELITLHDSGAVFRLQISKMNEEPFRLAPNANVELPDSLRSDRFSVEFADGRFAIAWGGDEPKLSVIRSTGQIASEHDLPDEPQATPIDLDAGIVVALPGRLHMVASNARDTVEEFLLPVVEGQTVRWNSLTRLDGTHLLSLEEPGVLRRIEYRTEPLKHLAEAGNLELKTRAVIPPLLTVRDRLLVATESKQLLSVAADSLQILSSRLLNSLPTGAWNTRDSVFLQLQNGTLVCLENSDEFTERWRVSLSEQSVAGQPLDWNDTVVVPVSPEGVWILKKKSGELVRKVKTLGTCAGDPLVIEGQVVIPLSDGSLFFLPDSSEGGDQL